MMTFVTARIHFLGASHPSMFVVYLGLETVGKTVATEGKRLVEIEFRKSKSSGDPRVVRFYLGTLPDLCLLAQSM